MTKYTTIRPIGSGPTCDVSLCREVSGLGREVVVKRWRSERGGPRSGRDAFFQANQAWSKLADEGLVTLYGLDQADDAIAYEHHPRSGKQAIAPGGLPAADVMRWMRQAFGGLRRVHESGVLHFNLKPTNLLLTSGGGARLIDGTCVPTRGMRELLRPTGSQKYLAPEMIEPAVGAIGAGTDIYCLAFVLLELLIGTEFDPLFVAGDSDAVDLERNWLRWHADVNARLPSLDRFRERVPKPLFEVFDRALVKKPSQRYQRCEELLADLAAASSPPEQGPASAAIAPTRPAAGGSPTVAPLAPHQGPATAPAAPAPPGPRQPASPPIAADSIPRRPPAPIVLRCFGVEAEMIGVNTDSFSVGGRDTDVPLPAALIGDRDARVLFARGPEGWRVSPLGETAFYLNQNHVEALTPVRSGDVVRFIPGGPGFQFTIFHRNSEAIGSIVAKYAPRLMGNPGAGRAPLQPAAGPAPTNSGSAPARRPPQPAPTGVPKPAGPSPWGRMIDVKSWDKSTKNWGVLILGLAAMAAAVYLMPSAGPSEGDPASGAQEAVPEPHTDATPQPEPLETGAEAEPAKPGAAAEPAKPLVEPQADPAEPTDDSLSERDRADD